MAIYAAASRDAGRRWAAERKATEANPEEIELDLVAWLL